MNCPHCGRSLTSGEDPGCHKPKFTLFESNGGQAQHFTVKAYVGAACAAAAHPLPTILHVNVGRGGDQ